MRILAKKRGFKESNFDALKKRLELITALTDSCYKFTQMSASYCLIYIADKIRDAEISQQVKFTLSKISEPCSLPYVCHQVKYKFTSVNTFDALLSLIDIEKLDTRVYHFFNIIRKKF